MSNATSHSDNNPVSRFLTNFPSYVQCTGTHYFPNIRVFWSQIQRHHDALVIQEKIKTAFYNLNISHLNGLIQFWAPTPAGMLSTSDQPFVLEHLDSCFLKYRLCCMTYQYNIDDDAPPASAFLNCFPEVLLDLRPHHGMNPLLSWAFQCDFTSSIFLPVFYPTSLYCVGVVECSIKHSSALLQIFTSLTISLQIVGLTTFHVQEYRPYKTICGLKLAVHEIKEALQIVYESHHLLLAQVWIAYDGQNHLHFSSSLADTKAKQMFGLKLIGYYVASNDDDEIGSSIKEYYDTCDTLPLKVGEGVSGKTLQTYEPHFCQNISELSDKGLLGLFPANVECSCLAICLKSIHTRDLRYVFEFLWPRNRYYFLLLEPMFLTLKRCLSSFKIANGAQLGDKLHVRDVENPTGHEIGYFKILEGNKLSQVPKESEYKKNQIPLPRADIKQFGGYTKTPARNLNVFFSTSKHEGGLSGLSKLQGRHYVKRKLSHLCESQEDNTENQESSLSSKSVTFMGNDKVLIKVKCGDDRTMSYIPISSKFSDIKKNIDKKYKLSGESYELEYFLDNEWIMLDADRHWETCIFFWRRSGHQVIQLRVRNKK